VQSYTKKSKFARLAKNYSPVWPKTVRPFGQKPFTRLAKSFLLPAIKTVASFFLIPERKNENKYT